MMRACVLISAVFPQSAADRSLQQIFVNMAAHVVATLQLNPWNFERQRYAIRNRARRKQVAVR